MLGPSSFYASPGKKKCSQQGSGLQAYILGMTHSRKQVRGCTTGETLLKVTGSNEKSWHEGTDE